MNIIEYYRLSISVGAMHHVTMTTNRDYLQGLEVIRFQIIDGYIRQRLNISFELINTVDYWSNSVHI